MKNDLNIKPTLDDATTWARQAGEILSQGFDLEHQVVHKGELDLVTEMDHRSERYLIEQIQRKFPGHAIITEETGHVEGDMDHCWYIDPLDGTINYAHRFPLYSVSLAYAEKGTVVLGAVCDPSRAECFTAERGKGAYLNGAPIHVSNTASIKRSLLCTGFSNDDHGAKKRNIDLFARFQEQSQGVRRLGSAALDLCYVAAGRLDGFWEMALHAWDVAAGALIVEEAGGKVTRMDGDPGYFAPPYGVIAANPVLHPLMLEVIRGDNLK